MTFACAARLGYPVIYYLPTAEQTNCLGNVPLIIHEFKATLALADDTSPGSNADPRVLTSFSIPEPLLSEGSGGSTRKEVVAWTGLMTRKWGGQGAFHSCTIDTRSVTMGAVAL